MSALNEMIYKVILEHNKLFSSPKELKSFIFDDPTYTNMKKIYKDKSSILINKRTNSITVEREIYVHNDRYVFNVIEQYIINRFSSSITLDRMMIKESNSKWHYLMTFDSDNNNVYTHTFTRVSMLLRNYIMEYFKNIGNKHYTDERNDITYVGNYTYLFK